MSFSFTTMKTFDDIEEFRRGHEAVAFAQAWIREGRQDQGRYKHQINLSIWEKSHPHEALGIILNIIEQLNDDDDLCESVAMGPATEIVEKTDSSFTPFLRHAVTLYPRFALFTKYLRENSNDGHWTRLHEPGPTNGATS